MKSECLFCGKLDKRGMLFTDTLHRFYHTSCLKSAIEEGNIKARCIWQEDYSWGNIPDYGEEEE
jgi:hypothetical protein